MYKFYYGIKNNNIENIKRRQTEVLFALCFYIQTRCVQRVKGLVEKKNCI